MRCDKDEYVGTVAKSAAAEFIKENPELRDHQQTLARFAQSVIWDVGCDWPSCAECF